MRQISDSTRTGRERPENAQPTIRHWAGPEDPLGLFIRDASEETLRAYQSKPKLVERDANEEADIARGGYANRQLFELVQNGADAAAATSETGNIQIRLTRSHLYCADNGKPIDERGYTALELSHMSPKRGTEEIGRFGLGFKSVLGVSDAPEFLSLTGSFRFDPDRARQRIRSVATGVERFPTLSLPEPIDPHEYSSADPILAELMTWASNIVRLPLRPGARSGVTGQIREFPEEFLLFVDHVASLTLSDDATGVARCLQVDRQGDRYVLSDGDSSSRWRVFSRRHALSDAAREDRRSLDDAHECVIRWAAPTGKPRDALDTGYFWAFFPTLTPSLVSGILNAPWKTNEDRQNLLPGPYNDELIEAAAMLVAENLHTLSTASDPGKHLDALPRRRAPGDAEQSEQLRDRLYSVLSERPVVPNQNGKLRRLREVKYPPKELTAGGRHLDRAPMERWAELPTRPPNWLHNRAATLGRLAKIDRLFAVLPRKHWQSGDAPRARIDQWLWALVRGQPPKLCAKASMAAIQTAALVARIHKPFGPMAWGRIVLGADGTLRFPDPEAVFLPDPAMVRSGGPTSTSEVHPELVADEATLAALRKLGLIPASPTSRFSEFAEIAFRSGADKESDTIWLAFWGLSREVEVAEAARIIRKKGWGKPPRVYTMAGTWSPTHSVLLPGAFVGERGDMDRAATVDVQHHDEDMQLLRSLGVREGPREKQDLISEPWFSRHLVKRRLEFGSRQIANVGSNPQENRLNFESTVSGGPLTVLRVLSPAAAARYTHALLHLDSVYRPWTMRHDTQAKYGSLECESPALEIIRKHGRVETASGPELLRDALGSRPKSRAALYALLAHPNAGAIKGAFGLSDPNPIIAGESDPEPLLDVWPGLGDYLREDHKDAALWRCESIEVAGQNRKCVLHDGDIFLATQVEDESDQLRLVTQRLATRLDERQMMLIRLKSAKRDVQKRRARTKRAANDAQRLLRAVGGGESAFGTGVVYSGDYGGRKRGAQRHSSSGGGHCDPPHGLAPAISEGIGSPESTEAVGWVIGGRERQMMLIRLKSAKRDVQKRRARTKRAANDAQRLLRAVGEENLRSELGSSTLAIMEGERGALSGIQVAEAVIAIHHTDSLRRFRRELDHLSPPKQWAGSSAAVRFVRSLGFSPEWAGQRGKRRQAYVPVPGPFRLPPLHDYQRTIVANVRGLLRRGGEAGEKRRGMISLPTGSGKTRVAVQALVEAIRDDGFRGGVLWVADRDELCEQAVESWSQVWSAIGGSATLRVSRLWGGQPNPQPAVGPHVVVSTVQTLHRRAGGLLAEDGVFNDIGVVVFDEAHRSIAPTFTEVMEELGLTRWQRPREPFLLGLTATPYRGYNEEETAWLARRYASNRLDHGAFQVDDAEYVVKELQDNRVLAHVEHRTIKGGEFSLTDDERRSMAHAPWLPHRAERHLANDRDRTRRILDAFDEQIPADWSTLVFATSVEHAGVLAALLTDRGIRARAVSAKTETATRRSIVEEFRSGEIKALVNYAIFREGFDAPRTRAIVVARPVYSPNLYFQMIGRGMRGIKNGGNDRCLVLNVQDNIWNFDRALAFTKLDWLWVRSRPPRRIDG